MFRVNATYKTNTGTIISPLLVLLFSTFIIRTTTIGGSNFQNVCFESCMKLVRETIRVDVDQKCPKTNDPHHEEMNSCRSNCKDITTDRGNKTVFSIFQDIVVVSSPPWLYNFGYTFLTLKWNISLDESRSVALYILQVQSNFSLHNRLEIPPLIPRYIVVKGENYRIHQNFTVENLVNGFNYKFRVATVSLNGKSSEYSNWSPWYQTSSVCKRTTGEIVRRSSLYSVGTKRVYFPCPVRRMSLNVSLKASDRKPVVLDAILNWENPPGIHQLHDLLVKVTVKLLKHQDEKVDATCSHYHEKDFIEHILVMNRSESLHLPSDTTYEFGKQKKSIHFGCSYVVKFEVNGATSANSFETTATFNIPECLQGIRSCPIRKRSHDSSNSESSGVIKKQILSIGNGNTSYAANISWSAKAWSNPHEIQYFFVTLEEWPSSSGGFQYSNSVSAKDGASSYHVVFYNLSDEKSYQTMILAYHGVNCLHDTVEHMTFQIRRPCNQGCNENATCRPRNVYDGTAVCVCKGGYTGNGTTCLAMEPEQLYNNDEKSINVLPIIIPLAFVLASAAVIVALITWRIKRKRELVLNVIGAHESAISSSSSNTNLYQQCPPMQARCAEPLSKVNEVELEEKEVNVIYVPQEIQEAIIHGLTDGYEFNAEQIKLEECLGKGAFGYVHRARALGITEEPEWALVAVKTLSEPVTDKSVEDFIAEIELMKKIGDHENIIRMLGCCTLTMPICLIMEYAPYGNLLTYLRTVKSQILEKDLMKKNGSSEKLELTESPLSKETHGDDQESTHAQLLHEADDISEKEKTVERQAHPFLEDSTYLESFALQIANGMAYVAGRGIVHRDLAARNILIGKDYKLKISDFGLSKEGVYVKSTSGKIPLRWLSIEAIRERIYSSASDVWSFGIVLWEICTLGDFPYPTLSDRELLKFLVSGERLEKPKTCSDEIYALMLKCWKHVPEDRPTFADLRDVLWKMNTGENPYINIDPMQEDISVTADQPEESKENPILE